MGSHASFVKNALKLKKFAHLEDEDERKMGKAT